MIFYDGATGGLGQHFAAAVPGAISLSSRLGDRGPLREELAQYGPSIDVDVTLVQMAAKVSVTSCEIDPMGARWTNVVSTAATVGEFVRWARGFGFRPRVVYVSTGHVYEASDYLLTESSPVAPRSTYACTKLEAEEVLGGIAKERSFPLTIARVFGLIGLRQRVGYLLPELIRRARTGDLSPIPGLNLVRDYLDTRDVCRVLAKLIEMAAPGVYNICSGEPTSVGQLAELVFRRVRGVDVYPLGTSARPTDALRIVGDPAKLIALTCEHPRKISLEKTIDDALEVL